MNDDLPKGNVPTHKSIPLKGLITEEVHAEWISTTKVIDTAESEVNQ